MKSNSYSFIENYFIKSRDFRDIREIRLFHHYWRKTFGWNFQSKLAVGESFLQ